MNHLVRKTLIVLAAILLCGLVNPCAADGYRTAHHEAYHGYEPGTDEMIFDALIIRPVSLVTTVAGSVIYVISLPFSIPGGNEREAREKLVYEPARYTFKRPLGEFPADHRY